MSRKRKGKKMASIQKANRANQDAAVPIPAGSVAYRGALITKDELERILLREKLHQFEPIHNVLLTIGYVIHAAALLRAHQKGIRKLPILLCSPAFVLASALIDRSVTSREKAYRSMQLKLLLDSAWISLSTGLAFHVFGFTDWLQELFRTSSPEWGQYLSVVLGWITAGILGNFAYDLVKRYLFHKARPDQASQ